MSWEPEINKCISNGYGKLKQAFRFKNFLSQNSKKLVVQSYILSQFNYSSIILQNLTLSQMEDIQKFQNTCVRFILNLKKFDHISHGFKSLGFLKMQQLREVRGLTFMHKILKGKAPAYLLEKLIFQGDHHSHLTRARSNIRCSRFRTNYGRNRFFNFIGKKYNEITRLLDISTSLTVNTFKFKLKKHFSGV